MLFQGVLIGLGGFFGAISRYWVGKCITTRTSSLFPYSTLTVNLIGSLFLGYAIGYGLHGPLYSFIGIGYFGAFTTFSTFKLENIQLHEKQNWRLIVVYLFTSYTFGLLLALFGMMAGSI
jgi:fluoride exporter